MAQFITNITDNKVATNTWMADKILPSSFVASSDTSVLTVNLSLTEGTSSLNIGGSVTGGTSYDGPQISFILTYIRGELCVDKDILSETLNKWYLKNVTSPTSYSSTYSNFKTAIYDNISTIYSYSAVNTVPTASELQYKVVSKLIGYDYNNLKGASLGLISVTALTKRYKVSILNVSFDTNTTNDISGDNVKFVERAGIAYGNNYVSYNSTGDTLIPNVANDANKGITTQDYYKWAGLSNDSKKCITHNTTSNIVYNDIIPVVGKMYLNGTYTKYANVNDEGLKIYPPKVDNVDVLKSILNEKDLYLDESNFMGVLYSEKKPNKLNYDRELPNIKMSTMRNVKWNTKPFEVSKTSAVSSWADNFTFSIPETHEFFNTGYDESEYKLIFTIDSVHEQLYEDLTSGAFFSESAFGDAKIVSIEENDDVFIITFDKPVTSIGVSAFDGCTILQSIAIPDSVTSIGYNAFYGCSALQSIAIPDSVTSIGYNAFYGCSTLQSIAIPDSVTSIGNSAFYGCSALQSIAIPDSVTSIGNTTFYRCSALQSITIPDSVTSIGSNAFYRCTALQSITIPDSVTSIRNYAFQGCTTLHLIKCESTTPPSITNSTFVGLPENFKIIVPEESLNAYKTAWIEYESHIVGIDNYIAYTSTSMVTPYNTTAFGGAAIISNEFSNGRGIITFNRRVTSIGNNAFYRCTALQSIVIPDSVTSIENDVFGGCINLQLIECKSITPPSIGNYVFAELPENFKIIVPEESLDAYKTVWSKYESHITVADYYITYIATSEVTPYNTSAFGDATIISNEFLGGKGTIYFDKKVTLIGNNAFRNCSSLQSIVIPDSVTSIGNYAFRNCSSLQSIVIPNSVTSIGNYAFYGCTSLQSIVIPDSVTSIGDYAFSGCTSLQSIVIPDSVTSIGQYAFSGCSALQSIAIPDSVTLIERYAFQGCSAIQSIIIPDSVTSIGQYAFKNCTSLQSIIIPDSVTSIGSSAFFGCSALQSIIIPDSVTSIGNYAFQGCSALQSIIIPDSVTSIGTQAFDNCASLQSIVIPDSVTSIGNYAFHDCASLQSIVIPGSVTSIGDYAFNNCTALKVIECKSTVPPTFGINVVTGYQTLKIIVPSGSVNAYKTAWDSSWNGYSSYVIGADYYIAYIATSKVTPYDANAFGGATITSNTFSNGIGIIKFNKKVTSIGTYAFQQCTSLQSIIIPDSVTSIGHNTFDGCTTLQSIIIPDSVTSIGISAFHECTALQSIIIPDSVTSIGNSAFFKCSALQSIIIPDSVTSIGHHIFNSCTSLQSITIPDSVISIGNYVFSDCTSLQSITIPDSVISIGEYVFQHCTALQSIEYKSITPPSLGTDAFYNLPSNFKIIVPEESLDAYKAAWSAYKSHIVGKYYPKSIKVSDKGSYLNITNIYPGDLIYNTPAYIEPAINMNDNTKDKILYNNLKYISNNTAKNLYYLSDGTSLSEALVADDQGRAIIPIEIYKINPSVISVGDGTNITLSDKTTGLSPTAYATLTTGSKIDLKIPYSKLTKAEINKLEQLFIDELQLYVFVTYGSTVTTNPSIKTRNLYIKANEFIDQIYLYKHTNGNIALGLSTGKGTISITGSVLPIDDNSPEENTPATTDLNVNVGGNTGGSIGGAGSLNPSLPSLNSYEILYIKMNVVLPINSLNQLFTSQTLLIGTSL